MRSKILKDVLDNATPEVIARVNQISNDLLIEKLWEENEEMKMILKSVKRFFDNTPHLTEMQKPMVLNGIEELLNKYK